MFTNVLYFPFLMVSALIYWLLPKRGLRTGFLSLCSLAFIWHFDPKALYVVLALTLFTYGMALLMVRSQRQQLYHSIGLLGLLLVLIAFKYLGFLTETVNGLTSFVSSLPQFEIEKLFLPLGLSYIIFKYISYLTDIMWGIVKPGRFIDFLCYGSLFTTFVAGPIERFERLKPQLESPRDRFQVNHLEVAFFRIVIGLFKKLVIADWMGYFINPIWQHPSEYSAIIRVAALFGYSMQIYFDFSGYSDIAIGSSRLFGLTIMENFNNPYFAPNISQFWRRWHISLSDWIRDYLFFPLSQGRSSKLWLTLFVPVIAMGLCGLWHGAAWHYMIWGVWHGIGIAIYQYWNQYKRAHKKRMGWTKAKWANNLGILMTFVYVTIGWWWFR